MTHTTQYSDSAGAVVRELELLGDSLVLARAADLLEARQEARESTIGVHTRTTQPHNPAANEGYNRKY